MVRKPKDVLIIEIVQPFLLLFIGLTVYSLSILQCYRVRMAQETGANIPCVCSWLTCQTPSKFTWVLGWLLRFRGFFPSICLALDCRDLGFHKGYRSVLTYGHPKPRKTFGDFDVEYPSQWPKGNIDGWVVVVALGLPHTLEISRHSTLPWKKQQFSFTEPDGLSKLSKLSTISIEIYIYVCVYMYIIILDTGHLTLADDFMMRKNPERGYAKAWLIAKLCKIAPSILFPYQGFRCHPFI